MKSSKRKKGAQEVRSRAKKPAPKRPEPKPSPVLVEVRTTKWGRRGQPFVQTVEAPFVGNGIISLAININVRETEVVEVRPVRRDLNDIQGILGDAARLANEPVH